LRRFDLSLHVSKQPDPRSHHLKSYLMAICQLGQVDYPW
jgi:hypothetical protein